MARHRAAGVELTLMPKNTHRPTGRGGAKQVSKWGKWRSWLLVLLIIGGLAVATFITLLLVPVFYAIFVLDLKWIGWEKAHVQEDSEQRA